MDSTRGVFDAEAVATEPAMAQAGAVKTSAKPCDKVETAPRTVHNRSAPCCASKAVNVPAITEAVGTATRLSDVSTCTLSDVAAISSPCTVFRLTPVLKSTWIQPP